MAPKFVEMDLAFKVPADNMDAWTDMTDAIDAIVNKYGSGIGAGTLFNTDSDAYVDRDMQAEFETLRKGKKAAKAIRALGYDFLYINLSVTKQYTY